MTRIEEQVRADIVEAGRRLYARAYIASNDGNISARLDDRRLIATPKGVSKGFMTPDMLVTVDYQGNKLAGDRDASTELPMHLEIYRNRPDMNAVVHAHPRRTALPRPPSSQKRCASTSRRTTACCSPTTGP